MTRLGTVLLPLTAAVIAACAPPSPSGSESGGPPATPIPDDVAAVVRSAAPGIDITGAEPSSANDEFEVSGRLPNGDEVELDLLQTDQGWAVLEIQRDVEWSSVPQPVRVAAAAARDAFEPVRVIESTQAADGAIVYELFRAPVAGVPSRGPALEVRWHAGRAEIITPGG